MHRLDRVGDDAVQVDREPLERDRPRDVAQVVEHALDDHQLALDGPLERLAVLEVVEHLLNQLAAVADVLNRMREIVDEAGGDAAEHRLPFLLSDVLLQLDQPIGHRVERVAELPDLVAARRATTRSSIRPSAIARVARVSAKMRLMNDRPHNQPRMTVPSSARPMAASSCTRSCDGDRECLLGRLLDDDGPVQIRARRQPRRAFAPPLVSIWSATSWVRFCSTGREFRPASRRRSAPEAMRRFLSGSPCAMQPLVLGQQQRVALLPDLDPVDRAPQLFERNLADEPARIPRP